MFAQSAHKYIVASRISQGNLEFNNSSAEERDDIETRWLRLKDNMKGFYALKQKEKGKVRDASPSAPRHATLSTESLDEAPRTGWFQSRNMSADERRRLQDQKKAFKKKRADGSFVEDDVKNASTTGNIRGLDDEFEAAIQAAVHETSRGNAAEDARIEQAIRSSVGIMRKRSVTMSSQASSNSGFSNRGAQFSGWVPDVKHPLPEKREYPYSPDDMENITDEEYQALIEEALKQSITENQQRGIHMHDLEEENGEDDDYKKALEVSQAEHENSQSDEEALRQAIEASQAEQHGSPQPDNDDELKRALAESERAHREELARINSLKSEEDIVMEYVKKQSLAEAAFRNAKGKNAADGLTTNEDEELRRALEESMITDKGVRRGAGGGPSHF